MKKLLFISFALLCMISCTNYAELSLSQEESLSEVEQKYQSYKTSAQESIQLVLESLGKPNARSNEDSTMTGDALVLFLASIPKDTIDSLYYLYCTPEAKVKYEILQDTIESIIIQESSLEEYQKLNYFTDSYIESGGHNLSMLQNATRNVSPIIKDCMISSAASIDEFSSITQYQPSPQTLEYNSYCLHMLARKTIKSAVLGGFTNAVVEIGMSTLGIPGVDLVTGLILAGVDLYSAIELAHEYNMCCLTHLS